MMQTVTLLPISLVLFDGEAGGANGGQIGAAPDAGAQTGGVQSAPVEAPDAGEETPEERRARYREARKEFKDLYDEDTQRLIDRRFKETRGLEEQLGAVRPVLDMLFSKYGVEAGDVDALEAAINEDTTFWEDAAEERGLTVEQYKDFARLERQVNALNAEREARDALAARAAGEQRASQQLQAWYEEGEALKAEYPSFDLNRESENPVFVALLRNGFTVKNAFEAAHLEDIKNGVAAVTAKAAEKQITANIKARGTRPSEAGSKTGVTSKIDVSKLDRKAREDMIRRAAKGEVISF